MRIPLIAVILSVVFGIGCAANGNTLLGLTYTLTIPAIIITFYVQADITEKNHREQAVKLATAGNALTDTIRTLFEELKRMRSTHAKQQGKLTEYNTRIHHLEQIAKRNATKQKLQQRIRATADNTPEPIRHSNTDAEVSEN